MNSDILLSANTITHFKIDSGANVSITGNELTKQLKVHLRNTTKRLFEARKLPLMDVQGIAEVFLIHKNENVEQEVGRYNM